MSKDFQKEKGQSAKKSSLVTKYKGFEVLCVPNAVAEFRAGHLSLQDTVVSLEIYTNASKFVRATQAELDESFPTMSSLDERIKLILMKGEFQLTSEERHKLVEQRRNEVTHHFNTHYLDPTTMKPHPVSRLESALDTYKIKIDIQIPLKKQLELVKKDLVGKLPLKPNKMAESS